MKKIFLGIAVLASSQFAFADATIIVNGVPEKVRGTSTWGGVPTTVTDPEVFNLTVTYGDKDQFVQYKWSDFRRAGLSPAHFGGVLMFSKIPVKISCNIEAGSNYLCDGLRYNQAFLDEYNK